MYMAKRDFRDKEFDIKKTRNRDNRDRDIFDEEDAPKRARGRNRKKSEDEDAPTSRLGMRTETIQAIWAVVFLMLAAVFGLAALHRSGIAGEKMLEWFTYLLGVGYYLLPIFCVLIAIVFLKDLKKHFSITKTVVSVIAFLSALGLVDLIFKGQGGAVGNLISSPMLDLFAFPASIIVLAGILTISLLTLFDAFINPTAWFRKVRGTNNDEDAENEVGTIGIATDDAEGTSNDPRLKRLAAEGSLLGVKMTGAGIDPADVEGLTAEERAAVYAAKAKAAFEAQQKAGAGGSADDKKTGLKIRNGDSGKDADAIGRGDSMAIGISAASLLAAEYKPIPVSLLEGDRGKPGVGDIKANANIIKRTLQNFGIDVEMDEIAIGPTVTRYALKPAEGVKLSRIVALQNDLSLALAAHPLRIEAPIPGKSLVGIEVPNTAKTTVGLASLLSQAEFQESDKPLLFALGKSISGKSHFANLAKMPHLLIAGATGSGKSVTIHTIIVSLLYRNAPQNLKFIMIDPKRVELTLYNKIPHLLTPVITDAKKAILALRWAAKEMDRRYDILQEHSVRDIQSYHKNIVEPALAKLRGKSAEEAAATGVKLPETMPYIAVVIDELADIMQTYPRELEAAIVRLAQMSRAVGIHLMLSTQRPSVNVITGLIKANVPARLALQVASQIDSRTILDMPGAEKLLGAGDMLFLSGDMAQPTRIQSAFISEGELKKVVQFINTEYETIPPDDITRVGNKDKNAIFEQTTMSETGGNSGSSNRPGGAADIMSLNATLEGSLGGGGSRSSSSFDDDGDGGDDELYEEARAIVMEAGKASTSYIQRKLRVGYARAARLMDILEERGVIGAADGSKPRMVMDGAGAGGGANDSSDDMGDLGGNNDREKDNDDGDDSNDSNDDTRTDNQTI